MQLTKNPRAAEVHEKQCECKECAEASDGKTPATLELVKDKNGWWYDLRAHGRSITPAEPLKSRHNAMAHAKEAAHLYGLRINTVEYTGCEAGY